MPALFAGEFKPSNTHVARGVSGAISIAAQVAFGVAIVSISSATVPGVIRPPKAQPQLVRAVFLPAPEAGIPVPAEPELKSMEEVKVPEPAPERPSLVELRAFENVALPARVTAEVRPVSVEPRPAPPSLPPPTPPAPSVGAFPTVSTVARTPEPTGRVETAGFDASVARTSQSRLGQTAVGAFDAAAAPGPRETGAANQRHTAVVETGFNQASAAVAPTQQSRVVRDGGFGASSSRERPAMQERSAPQQGGFNDARVVEPTRRAEVAPRAPAVVAVEVLSKPTPVYTDEARRLKIEGEVVLEVEFCASGAVRILRVVRGLGYGLDESALVAAQRIQFKPATSEGRPVDYRTTVQIVFRLA
jgi:TonB family protein